MVIRFNSNIKIKKKKKTSKVKHYFMTVFFLYYQNVYIFINDISRHLHTAIFNGYNDIEFRMREVPPKCSSQPLNEILWWGIRAHTVLMTSIYLSTK